MTRPGRGKLEVKSRLKWGAGIRFIEKWRGFLVNFLWSPFPGNMQLSPRKIRENSEQIRVEI